MPIARPSRGGSARSPRFAPRINIPGAEFIGVEFDGRIYRLKYMRGGEVIWIDVDAETGQIVRRQ